MPARGRQDEGKMGGGEEKLDKYERSLFGEEESWKPKLERGKVDAQQRWTDKSRPGTGGFEDGMQGLSMQGGRGPGGFQGGRQAGHQGGHQGSHQGGHQGGHQRGPQSNGSSGHHQMNGTNGGHQNHHQQQPNEEGRRGKGGKSGLQWREGMHCLAKYWEVGSCISESTLVINLHFFRDPFPGILNTCG